MWFCATFLLLLQAAPTAPDLPAQGLKAMEQKNYDAAVALFQKAIAADPKDYGAHFNLALAYSLLKKDADAVHEYQIVLQLKPGLYEADLNLGILYLRDKNAAAALPLLKQAAEAKPNEFRPTYYVGEALLADKQLEPARDTFEKALTLNPKSAAAEAGLARAQMQLDQLDDAAAHFEKAAELDGSYKDALLELGERYEAKKQNDKAIAIYQQFPGRPAVQERLGQLMLVAGKAADAIPRLEAAVQQSPTTANRMALAMAYVENKEPDKALNLVAQALQGDPKNYDARMLAGRILRDQHKYPQAAGQFLKATELKPDSVEAWNELAAALIVAENYQPAMAALDRLKALGAETTNHYYLRAIILDKYRQLQPALDYYEKFLAGSNGQHPDEEFKARQRARILRFELSKRR